MELVSIETLDEFELDGGDPAKLVVIRCSVEVVPPLVFDFAMDQLERWGEEVISTRLYSLEPDEGCVLVGVRCEV